MTKRIATIGTTALVWLVLIAGMQPAIAERLTPERLWDLVRITDAAVSPDGRWVAYLATRYDLAENAGKSDLLLQEIPDRSAAQTAKRTAVAFDTRSMASKPQRLLEGVKGLNSLGWLNRSGGPKLIYVATPDGEEARPQAWMLDPAPGAVPQQLTHVPQGIGNLKPSPTGDAIAFTVDVKLDQTVNEIFPDLPQADARIIDGLLYRHWDQWHDYAYSHVHVATIGADGRVSEPLDLMPGMRADCPLPPFGGREQFEFSPDGQELALTLKLVNNPAESTDSGIYLVSTRGGPLQHITPGMPGYDMEPRYSPDGRFIAFHSMARGGFESDRNRIMLYDRATETLREITVGLDQTTHHATWSPDSKTVYFYSETRGTTQVFALDAEDPQLRRLSTGRFDLALVDAIPNSPWLLVRQQSMLRPVELALVDVEVGEPAPPITLTDVNGQMFEKLELPKIEQRFFKATDGKSIHCWVIFPPDYDPQDGRQWPMLTYCQGGPQSQIGQWFSYRWNFHMMADHGYVVLAINRRGLPGFGREWNDAISRDWGGQAMQDILAATDGMLADPRIDRSRVAAIGASFGGYTVYWLMGNSDDRFCAMVAHCGVYNLESMYGSTEELFFVNWDLGGPYWSSDEVFADYQRFSPHRFAGKWKTPLLVIHGEKDFRVPVTQGMEAFTAAQVQGVPSRFLYFPQEGHWVLSPQNGVLWGRVFFDWLDRYCRPSAAAGTNQP
ncbi:MAG: S9 family peptidase [Planctomycetota bacterium]|nr:MAG: S9 family peptidase [Planctomycetota bacterium]